MIKINNSYNLPDYQIINSDKKFDFCVWIPGKTYIVLGRSDTVENSIIEENAEKKEVEVIKRPSGGHTVVLSPKTIVISMKFDDSTLKTKEIFKQANSIIISTLSNMNIKNLSERGVSDICIGEKKILGSSMYKKGNFYFYHSVLNHSQESDIFEILLKHPPQEPEYRQGRNHRDFVTSLLEQGYIFSIDLLKQNLVHSLKLFSKKIN